MKNSIKLLGALLLGSIAGTASAAPIVGDIGLVLRFGSSVMVDTAANTVMFSTTAMDGTNSRVNIATGDYAVLGDQFATYANFTYSPFAAQVIFSGATFSFNLTNITTIDEVGADAVTLKGVGTMSLTGFDDTIGSWSLSADRANASAAFNFSSTATTPLSVPDGGTTALLLGVGLVSMSFIARRRSA